MNLTTKSFISLFDTLNEDSKSEILSHLLSKTTLNGISNHPVLIKKYKDEILKNDYLRPFSRLLITKTNDPFFLHQCYSEPRFLQKFNIRTSFVNTWKFYYVFKDRIHITSSDVFPEPNMVKLPFNFQKLVIEGNMSLDDIYVDEYEQYEGRLVIREYFKWYDSFYIKRFSHI